MNLEELMTDLIIAQHSLQANSNVLNRARGHMGQHWSQQVGVTAVTQSVGTAPVTATQKTQDDTSFTDKISNAVKSLDESHQIADGFAGQQRPVTSNH